MGTIKSDNIQARTDSTGVQIKAYKETIQSLTSNSGAVAIDLSQGNAGTLTLTENVTVFNFTNVPTSGLGNFTLKITQHASSAKTVAISCSVNGASAANAKTAGAGGFTMTTTASRDDILTFLFFDAATPQISAIQDLA